MLNCRLTGVSASKGLFRSSAFAVSRSAGSTSCPSSRMQVRLSAWLTAPSLAQSDMMPGRVCSITWRSLAITVSGLPAMIMLFWICSSKLGRRRGLVPRPVENSTKPRRFSGEE